MSIQLIVGFGNPGPKYERTRHNAGWWWIDRIAAAQKATWQHSGKYDASIAKIELAGNDCWLMKPQTFMNLSGHSVAGLANFYKIPMDAVLAAHDELDIPCGTAKMKRGGGTGGHNGLNSIVECTGTQDFWRLRLGIGHPGQKDLVAAYVLKAASLKEQEILDAMIDRATGIWPYLNRDKILDGVTWLHTPERPPKPPKAPKPAGLSTESLSASLAKAVITPEQKS